MKKFFYSALMLITFCCITSNLNAQTPDTIWTKLIDCVGYGQTLAGILPASNGEFFIVYNFSPSPSDYQKVLYGKLNSTGDVVFYEIYGPDPNRNYQAKSITPTYDGGIIITGTVWDEPSRSIFLVKLNTNCAVQWDKEITNPSRRSIGLKSIQTPQGFTVLSNAWIPPQNINFAVLIKTDEVGNVLDSETYTDELPLEPYDIVRTQDNSLVFVCALGEYFPNIRMYKIDQSLNIVWMHPLNLPLWDFVEPICLRNSIDDGFLIGGSSYKMGLEWDYFGLLIKTNYNGFLQNYEVYGDSVANIGFFINSIMEFPDESVLSAGELLSNSQDKMLLMKTNPQMDTVYCMNLRNDSGAYSVIKCVDGNIVVGGLTYLSSAYSLYLVKLKSDIPSYTIGNEGLGIPIEDNQIVVNTLSYPAFNKNVNQLSSTLVGVDVFLDSITHTSTGDLEFTLSHNGVVDTLVFHAGGDGDDFIYTVLSDQAQSPVNLSLPPFIGDYKPYSPLTKFSGMDATGEWTLSILDNVTGNTGMLHAWGLRFYFEGPVGVDDETPELISDYHLLQNYPNPFNPSTVISYQLPVSGIVTLKIYDILGNEIATLVNEEKPAGSYEVEFSPSSLKHHPSSGIYFCRLESENYSKTIKMMYLK